MLLCGPPPPLSTLNDCSCANLNNSSRRSWRNKLKEWTYHPVTACNWLVWCERQFSNWASGTYKICIIKIVYKLLYIIENTSGPQIGRMALHLVLAFWSIALSHTSRPLANLQETSWLTDKINTKNCCSLYCWCMTLKMNNVKMWHWTKSLCFPCFVFKLI